MGKLFGTDGIRGVVGENLTADMAFPNARIYLLDGEGIRPADYRETEHYQLTRQFLENPERMLHYLLGNSD